MESLAPTAMWLPVEVIGSWRPFLDLSMCRALNWARGVQRFVVMTSMRRVPRTVYSAIQTRGHTRQYTLLVLEYLSWKQIGLV